MLVFFYSKSQYCREVIPYDQKCNVTILFVAWRIGVITSKDKRMAALSNCYCKTSIWYT